MLDEVRTRALAFLIPPPLLKLSTWIEADINCLKVSRRCAVRCGYGRVKRDIADAISDPEIERVTLASFQRCGTCALTPVFPAPEQI